MIPLAPYWVAVLSGCGWLWLILWRGALAGWFEARPLLPGEAEESESDPFAWARE